MGSQSYMPEATVAGENLLRRISALTLGFGFAAAITAAALQRMDWARGLAGGVVLAWLNFRWLSRGIRALVDAALAQAGESAGDEEKGTESGNANGKIGAKSRAYPITTYLTLVFRYALVGLGVYVIFNYLHVPLISIGLGLCAFVAAILMASVWEVVRPRQ
jgi:hypothetical protein